MYGPFPSCPKPLFQSEAKCIIVCDIEKKPRFSVAAPTLWNSLPIDIKSM